MITGRGRSKPGGARLASRASVIVDFWPFSPGRPNLADNTACREAFYRLGVRP